MFSVIFPGQGSQLVGMGKSFFEKYSIVKDLFKEADDSLRLPLSKIIEKNDGEIVKTENWGLLNLSYLIKKNRKGSFIHFKIKGDGKVIEQLEKNEAIDKKLLRNLTVRVKKFDLENNYFSKKEELENSEKKEKTKN